MKFLTKRDTRHTFKSNNKTNLKAHIIRADDSDTYCNLFHSEMVGRGNYKTVKKTNRPICTVCQDEYLRENPNGEIPTTETDSEQGSLF